MGDLLTCAEHQLATVPTAQQNPNWPGALARLALARAGLDNTQAMWESERGSLPAAAVPGTEAYDEPLAERNAEAWSYLCDWADVSHVLPAIARAATAHTQNATPSAEHTHTADHSTMPPQTPGHPHPGRPR